MEELGERRVWTKDDIPLVHGGDIRKNCDLAEEKSLDEDDDEMIDFDESAEFIQPEYSNEKDRIALRLFWRRFLEFFIKFVFFIISTICAGFQRQWSGPLEKSFITVFPFSVFCGYSGMFIYVILTYRWWHRASKYIRIIPILVCGAVFFAVGIMELYFLHTHSFTSEGVMYEVEYSSENIPIQKYYKHATQGTITSVACLSFTVTILCLIDAFVLAT